MSVADLPDAPQNREHQESLGETGTTILPVAAVYDSALVQLNLLDNPDSTEKELVAAEPDASPPSSESADDASGSEDAAASGVSGDVTASAADGGHEPEEQAALAELNALCGLDEATEEAAVAGTVADSRPQGDAVSVIVPASEGPAELDVTQVRLHGPPSFERVIWETSEGTRTEFSSGSEAIRAAASASAAEFESLLLAVMEAAANDPRQLRHLVYELARANLRDEAGQEWPSVTPEDIGALETAIARIEINLKQKRRLEAASGGRADTRAIQQSAPKGLPVTSLVRAPTWLSHRNLRSFQSGGGSPAPARESAPVEIVYPEREKPDASRFQRRVWLWFVVWPLIQLASVAGFCLALYLAVSGRPGVGEVQAPPAKVEAAGDAARSSGLPLPSTYGVYALSNGTLNELQALPIRAPDPRVQLSAEITKPSSTILPDGKVAFVLFQRDLLNSAPQKVAVRVVAHVDSSLTFNSGKATAVKPEASWHIRGNSYSFLVSPMGENHEMVLVRPEDPDFTFVPGRYALVFGALAYDFTVAGPITDPAQCLEGVETTGGMAFTECRPKQRG